MIFDFDPAKDEANRRKHGVSLILGVRVFDDPGMAVMPTIREGDEEERYKAVGLVDGKIYTAVHVWRGTMVRLISVRRSNVGEQRNHDCDSS